MSRPRISLVRLAQESIAEVLGTGDHAVDATAGNGHDTLFLAQTVGPAGRVTAFDIQPVALDATRRRLQEQDLLAPVRLVAAGHETMEEHIKAPIRAAMFNLGYLPGGDKTVTTRTDTSLRGLDAACRLLAPGGRISVMVYTGHPGGGEEHDAVLAFLKELGDNWRWQRANPDGIPAAAPQLFLLDLKLMGLKPTA
ncbi:class I SAM-dependent methyltransferase [Methylonatrum kenyense]|uniref:class I SAM-dependent methyltransferase n=1 Tax=Methylonatrum kenyense TaxID=455253 RepID=UPI0020BF9D7F|nr:class I SAM-dependent methyltransferase [Methylonatrum kenyense]MCK8515742.1 class I SAM-dependent methyltransferase [Methylonatrum kenyense]